MILRIRIRNANSGLSFSATNIFQISGMIDFDKLGNLLARIKTWVADERHYFELLDRNGIASFAIKETPYKYEFELLDMINDVVSKETVIKHVGGFSKLTVDDMIVKTRIHDIYKPRILLFSALRFFAKMSTGGIEKMTGFDHATVLNSGKAIGQFFSINDDFIKHGVESLAVEFGNVYFYDAVRNNKYPKK